MEEESKSNRKGEVLLMSKRVEINNKVFYFDFKENNSISAISGGGQFMTITSKSSSGISYSIVLPSAAISDFLESFHSCISSHQPQHLIIGPNKAFFFDPLGENRWGSFIKVSESSIDKNQSTTSIIIPSGRNQNEGWKTFARVLSEISTTSTLIFPPKQRTSDLSEQVVGLPDVSACIISDQSGESSSASQMKTESSVDEINSFGISRMMRAGPRTFVFDLQDKKNGPLLRISELMGSSCSSIFVPLSEAKQFHEMVGDCLKIPNHSGEGSSIADGEQACSPQVC